jgi:hypothetical protein
MPLIEITNEQVMELAQKLPSDKKQELLKILLTTPWESWQNLTQDGAEKARLAAQIRGYNWEQMSEEEQEEFIDNILHEN